MRKLNPSMKLKVAVCGKGGREHALAWKISQSPFCDRVVVVPGNAGINREFECINVDPLNFEKLTAALKDVDLVVIGPDDYLAAGMTDFLQAKGFTVFGPTKSAAKLEWSKSFAKDVMRAAGIPFADSLSVDKESLDRVAEKLGYPLVIKDDGLALGKGVFICANEPVALLALESLQGKKIFAEKFLQGREVSLFAICDGTDYVVMEPACDYKRLNDGDRGPNTGGMGAYSPAPWFENHEAIGAQIFPAVLNEMKKRGIPFSGLLYAGLMVDRDGFHVLEFNARFGDPETQVLLPRMKSDLLPLLYNSSVATEKISWTDEVAVNAVAASPGYPGTPEVGAQLTGQTKERVFYAGVKQNGEELVTAGGRVFSVTTLGRNFKEANTKASTALSDFSFLRMHYRRDIAGGCA